MSRLLTYDKDLTKTVHQREIESHVGEMIQHQTPRDFTQALMELGAMVCQKQPKCEMCPLKNDCKAYQTKTQSLYPNLPKNTKTTHYNYMAFVVKQDGHVVLVKRPDNGLLANLYTFPQYDGPLDQALRQFSSDYQVEILKAEALFDIDHVFSHQTWKLHVYELTLKNYNGLPFVKLSDFPYAIAKAHLNIIERL